MKDTYPTPMEVDTLNAAAPLLERMDGAIGEASTVMGAMLTELLRRTLRGGVLQIGEELHGYVTEHVDATIADRTPAIEQAAAEVAEHTARSAATEVAKEEVHVLQQRTEESDRQLAGRIEETARAAQQATAETARDLAGRIDQTRQQAEELTAAKSQELTGRIELTRKEVEEAAAAKAAELAGRIQEAEKRAVETAQAEMEKQIDEWRQRSREGTALMKARLDEIKSSITGLRQEVADEGKQRQEDQADLQQRLAALAAQLEQERQARHAAEQRLHQDLSSAREEAERLNARVAELEKPRGLRRLWAWFKRVVLRR